MAEYIVLRYVEDSFRGISFPFGIAYRSDDSRDYRFRIPEEGELVPRLGKDYGIFIEAFLVKLRAMLSTGKVPYTDAKPYSDEWWHAVQDLPVHRFAIETPKRVEVSNLETEMDLQFDALVQPSRPPEAEEARVDTMLNEALGAWGPRFEGHTTVSGYLDRPVKVLKKVVIGNETLVIDAVNLATSNAIVSFEAMLHRAHELKCVEDSSLKLFFGFFASPSGLNGEEPLIRFGEDVTGIEMHNFGHYKKTEDLIGREFEGLLK